MDRVPSLIIVCIKYDEGNKYGNEIIWWQFQWIWSFKVVLVRWISNYFLWMGGERWLVLRQWSWDVVTKFDLSRIFSFTYHVPVSSLWQVKVGMNDLLKHTCGLNGVYTLSKLAVLHNSSRPTSWCLARAAAQLPVSYHQSRALTRDYRNSPWQAGPHWYSQRRSGVWYWGGWFGNLKKVPMVEMRENSQFRITGQGIREILMGTIAEDNLWWYSGFNCNWWIQWDMGSSSSEVNLLDNCFDLKILMQALLFTPYNTCVTLRVILWWLSISHKGSI